MPDLVLLSLSVVPIALSVIFTAAAVAVHVRARNSSSWAPVPATVHRVEVLPAAHSYTTRIVYRYSFQGLQYESSRVNITGAHFLWRKPADALASQYQYGQSVCAYVDPADPEQAILLVGPHQSEILCFVGLAVLFLAIGVAAVLFAFGLILTP